MSEAARVYYAVGACGIMRHGDSVKSRVHTRRRPRVSSSSSGGGPGAVGFSVVTSEGLAPALPLPAALSLSVRH